MGCVTSTPKFSLARQAPVAAGVTEGASSSSSSTSSHALTGVDDRTEAAVESKHASTLTTAAPAQADTAAPSMADEQKQCGTQAELTAEKTALADTQLPQKSQEDAPEVLKLTAFERAEQRPLPAERELREQLELEVAAHEPPVSEPIATEDATHVLVTEATALSIFEPSNIELAPSSDDAVPLADFVQLAHGLSTAPAPLLELDAASKLDNAAALVLVPEAAMPPGFVEGTEGASDCLDAAVTQPVEEPNVGLAPEKISTTAAAPDVESKSSLRPGSDAPDTADIEPVL